MPAPTPQDVRHEMLGPYLQGVGAFLRAHGDENRPLAIPSGREPLSLSAEERKAAWSVLCTPDGDWTDPRAWIALGAGLHLAIATLLDETGAGDRGGSRDAPVARLAALREVAAAFTEGLRETIYETVAAGRADEAKRLSSFRNKLQASLAALRNAGVDASPPPIEVAVDATDEPAPQEPPPAPEPEPVEDAEAPTGPDPALAVHLRRAAAFLRARGNEDRPLAVSFGRRTLSVTASERRVLWGSLCEGRTPARAWQALIPGSVALQLAMLLALDELEREGRSREAEQAARLELDGAVSLASGVIEGFRAEIMRAVGCGAVDDAKAASAARSVFAATLAEARRALAEEAAEGTAGGGAADTGAGADVSVAAPPPAATAASRAPDERLKPFLERAEQLLTIHGHEDRPLSVPVGRRSWSLDAWERQVAWKVLCEDAPELPGWSLTLAHGAAAQLGALLVLERLGKRSDAAEAHAAAEADRDALLALLSEIVEKLRANSEAAAGEGKERLVENLSRFRQKLTESIRLLSRTRSELSAPLETG